VRLEHSVWIRRVAPEHVNPLRVVVVGGGFAGLAAVRGLRDAPVAITLVDPTGFQVFQPLLYQVASGVLAPQNVASAHERLTRRQGNVSVVQAEVAGFDARSREVVTVDGLGQEERVRYDILVLAAGMHTTFGPNTTWAEHALSLTTLEDALAVRNQVFARPGVGSRPGPVVVVGGGPTGVELAGALAESDAHAADEADVLLVEADQAILPSYPEPLRQAATEELRRRGVRVHLGAPVTNITSEGLVVGGTTTAARAILWAGGARVRPVVDTVAQELGATTDRQGRIVVAPDLSVPDHPDVFVVGDAAAMAGVPPLAPAALQTGAFAARVISARSRAAQPPEIFRYLDRGSLAVVTGEHAVGVLGPGLVRISGPVAKALWLGVHLYYLPGAANRAATAVRWAGRLARHSDRSRLALAG